MKIYFRLLLVLGCMLPLCAAAMQRIGGSEPIPSGMPMPDGVLALVNLPTRFSNIDGEGASYYEFSARETEQFQEAVNFFGGILMPRLELFVYDGVPDRSWAMPIDREQSPRTGIMTEPKRQQVRVDWEFVLWNPENFYRLAARPGNLFAMGAEFTAPFPPPRINLYLGPDNPVKFAKIKVPAQVTVIDKRVAGTKYKGSKGAVARVVARDMASGKILPKAPVTLSPIRPGQAATTFTQTTDAYGEAVFRDLPAAAFRITVAAPDYATRHVDWYENFGKNLETFDVGLCKAFSFSGVVRDTDRKPLAGVKVTARDVVGLDGARYDTSSPELLYDLTDENGHFEIEGLPRGYMQLWTAKEGYYRSSLDVFEVTNPKMIGPWGPYENILVMSRAGTLKLRVKNMEAAGKNRQVMIEVQPEGNPVGKWGAGGNVKPDGTWDLPNVPPGRYTIFAHTNPWDSRKMDKMPKQTIDLKPGEDRVVELELQ